MRDLYHELVLFLQSRNCFCYVPENDTEGGILGWNLSLGSYNNWQIIHSVDSKNHHEDTNADINFHIKQNNTRGIYLRVLRDISVQLTKIQK